MFYNLVIFLRNIKYNLIVMMVLIREEFFVILRIAYFGYIIYLEEKR